MSGLIPLREYQLEGVDRVRQRTIAGVSRLLFVLATGGGKTVVAAHIVSSALELESRTLFVAHRIELIKQSFCKLVRNGIPIAEVGIIMGDTPLAKAGELFPVDVSELSDEELWNRFGRRRPAARVQVGSIDTLRVRAKLGKLDLIIIDEAHRALARSYKDLVAAYPGAVVLGLTATPFRADGKGLDELFDELVVIATPALLVEQGHLVEPEVWTVPPTSRPDLGSVKMKGGDYEMGALGAACSNAELVGDIVEHWQRHAAGVRTVAFACTVEHSKKIAQRFRDAGVAAEHLDGETPTEERAAILRRLELGETLVVSNCGVLCEGWDQPSVKCAILARPTKSTGLYLQQAGRILRPWKGQRAIILDHAGCALEHGLPTDEREFSLSGDARRAKNAVASVRECPECYFVVPPGARVCPKCGAELALGPGGLDVAEVAGQLVRASDVGEAADLGLLGVIESEWRRKNSKRAAPMKPGWISVQFKKRTNGRWPPRSYVLPTLSGEELAARAKLEELLRESVDKGYAEAWAYTKLKNLDDQRAEERAKETVAKLSPAPATSASPIEKQVVGLEVAVDEPTPPAPAPCSTPPRRDPWDRPRPAPKPPAVTPPREPVELEEVAI